MEESDVRLVLLITFDFLSEAIQVDYQFGPHVEEANFSMGDGISFIKDSLETDFFIDFDVDESQLDFED